MKKILFILSFLVALLPLRVVPVSEVYNDPIEIFFLAGVVFEGNGSSYTKPDNTDHDKGDREDSKIATSVKIIPKRSSQSMIGMPENSLLPSSEGDTHEDGKNVQITNQTKRQRPEIKKEKQEYLIEGYKLGRNGKRAVYVHGEIIENNHGDISGYLYDKRGDKTYIYGYNISDDGGIYAKDNEANEYILDSR